MDKDAPFFVDSSEQNENTVSGPKFIVSCGELADPPEHSRSARGKHGSPRPARVRGVS